MRLDHLLTAALASSHVHGITHAERQRQRQHQRLTRGQPANTLQANAADTLCIDVKDNALRNNQPVQMWTCFGGTNQQWKNTQGRLQTGMNQCLDVPDGKNANGVQLQVYACTQGNTNQAFERVGSMVRWQNTDKCLDVTDGIFADGTPLQLWTCDSANPNQMFQGTFAASGQTTDAQPIAAPAPEPTSPAIPWCEPDEVVSPLDEAGNFLGLGYIALDTFIGLHPMLAPFKNDIEDAAHAVNIGLPPILLAAIAMQESSGNPNAAPGGLCQFTNTATWDQFSQGGNMYNARDNLFAAGRYVAWLLDAHQNNIDAVFAEYSGNNGAYLANLRGWMQGDYVYGEGT